MKITPPRVYKRQEGQISVRGKNFIDTLNLIKLISRNIENIVRTTTIDNLSSAEIKNPLVHISMAMDVNIGEKVLAKIGINLVTKAFGEQYVRHHAFNKTKQVILTEKGNIWIRHVDQPEFLKSIPDNCHVMYITSMKSRAGRYNIFLFIRLYGSMMVVKLTENAIKPPIDSPVFFIINYEKHIIQQLATWQMIQEYKLQAPQKYFEKIKNDKFLEDLIKHTNIMELIL